MTPYPVADPRCPIMRKIFPHADRAPAPTCWAAAAAAACCCAAAAALAPGCGPTPNCGAPLKANCEWKEAHRADRQGGSI